LLKTGLKGGKSPGALKQKMGKVKSVGAKGKKGARIPIEEASTKVSKIDKLESIGQDVAAKVASKNTQMFKCKECATNIVAALKEKGVSGVIINLETPYSNIWNDKAGKNISTNGSHRAVQVGNIVFDNINPNGVIYGDWIKQFDAPFGSLKVKKTEFNGTSN